MTIALTDIARCFQGTIPSIIATSSPEGEPNVTHLSQVFLVDDQHVAASNQFFAKTTANLAANPLATLMCPDPVDLTTYKLLVRHEGAQRDGALFDAASASIDAIAALDRDGRRVRAARHGHLPGVERRTRRDETCGRIVVSSPEPSIVSLRELGDRLACAPGLESVIDTSLEALDELLGHEAHCCSSTTPSSIGWSRWPAVATTPAVSARRSPSAKV